MTTPKISIITVVFNACKELEKTLANISELKYDNIELIVVDGDSSDGTKAVIESYSLLISKWISESDSGIYDAMNKGLRMATGDYVWFINAGDMIHDCYCLNNIFDGNETYADVFYGETLILSSEGEVLGLRKKRVPKHLKWYHFRRGMVVCHQSIIVNRAIAPEYNLKYRYAADVEWVLLSLKSAKTIVNTHQILSIFVEGGASTVHRRESLKERYNIMATYFGHAKTILSHIGFVFDIFKPKYRKSKLYKYKYKYIK